MKLFENFYRLTRFKVVVRDSFLPISIVGVIAIWQMSLEVVSILLVNLLIFLYAFAINDIEDSDDDAKDPSKAKRNPVSAGDISKKDAYILCLVIFFTSILISAFIDWRLIPLTFSGLVVGHVYSWKKIRLKNMPIFDFISHSYSLAAVQILTLAFAKGSNIDFVYFAVLVGVTLISIGGSFHNQFRDYVVDRKVNLRNSTSFLSRRAAKIVSNCFYISGILLCGIGLCARFVDIMKI